MESINHICVFKECQCHSDGTINKDTCNKNTGKCLCKPNWTGLHCDTAGKLNIHCQGLSIQDFSFSLLCMLPVHSSLDIKIYLRV